MWANGWVSCRRQVTPAPHPFAIDHPQGKVLQRVGAVAVLGKPTVVNTVKRLEPGESTLI